MAPTTTVPPTTMAPTTTVPVMSRDTYLAARDCLRALVADALVALDVDGLEPFYQEAAACEVVQDLLAADRLDDSDFYAWLGDRNYTRSSFIFYVENNIGGELFDRQVARLSVEDWQDAMQTYGDWVEETYG
jgi:hypothetical protein